MSLETMKEESKNIFGSGISEWDRDMGRSPGVVGQHPERDAKRLELIAERRQMINKFEERLRLKEERQLRKKAAKQGYELKLGNGNATVLTEVIFFDTDKCAAIVGADQSSTGVDLVLAAS